MEINKVSAIIFLSLQSLSVMGHDLQIKNVGLGKFIDLGSFQISAGATLQHNSIHLGNNYTPIIIYSQHKEPITAHLISNHSSCMVTTHQTTFSFDGKNYSPFPVDGLQLTTSTHFFYLGFKSKIKNCNKGSNQLIFKLDHKHN